MKAEASRQKRRQRNKKPHKTHNSLLPKHSTKHHKNTHQQINHAHQSAAVSSSKSHNSSSSSKSSSFLDKMKARLAGGHFRMLNEKLYTCTGKEALDYFKEDPELFDMLEWKKGKLVNPFAGSVRARSRPKAMPMNLVHGVDGLPRIILTEPTGSTAEVLLYGGQVVSWKNERREELLFRSSKANLKSRKAIRGGISICFPQFGNLAPLEQNGFARNRMWSLDSDPSPLPPTNSQSSVDLILRSTEEDLKIWPRCFELRLRVTLCAGKLTLIPRVRNTDNKAFSFVFTLCNYLSVSDISEVRVEGLETLDYLDNLSNRERFTEQADAITFDAEFERVYLSTPTKIAIIDHEKKRTFELRKDGMPDAVVWNPWDKKAKALQDLGDEDYQSMLCVNSAVIETPILLKPFEEWKGRQEISTVSSSYCSGQLDPRKVLYGFH